MLSSCIDFVRIDIISVLLKPYIGSSSGYSVISEFVNYMAHDADCSPKHAQTVIVGIIPPRQLERLNNALIGDALDLIAEYKTDA